MGNDGYLYLLVQQTASSSKKTETPLFQQQWVIFYNQIECQLYKDHYTAAPLYIVGVHLRETQN